ncbi:recombinase family protein [Clostridium butyricum]|uniref:recombinase family protein n=1 Tax=Clostridium butyricum TaxID=1492 RepID=UPI0005C173B7|nr:recombinase family protein [Clostridium butyricum]KIU07790.1 Resolvase domain containing protein [Clostridium butyricum]MBA8967621.1 DNA invertase Pin-like site-specific DNA recombinase [Clostridium butyricum]MBA8971312.1 DNA invertase Pin-like site-specific DNA recombinase [Clostridium butyricum]MBC2429374.1 recombinase family protein [Clostridium butyricum]NOW36822.1 DNA invertase Pin-like site-specific DNA recombinase [Clostridium butyricum]
MDIAYIRISDISQNEARQVEAMKNRGVEKIFIDKCSGKNTNRPELKNMLEFIREGDNLYIESFSRLARSTKDLLDLVENITVIKKANLVSLKENIDTQTAAGRMMLGIIGSIYQFERECLLERQKEGIKIAKEKGIYKGRKKIDFPGKWVEIYEKYKTREITAKEAMEELNLKRTTFYKLKTKYENSGTI